MAKPKIKNTKVSGYGLKSPWDFSGPDADQRAAPSPGAGDYYGTGIRNPMGRIRSSSVGNPVSPGKLGKPPKSLA